MEEIKVLHIGYANGDKTSGVAVSIPEYLYFQSKYCNCALLNLADFNYKNFECFLYKNYKKIESLPKQFSNPSIVVFHELYRVQFLKLYKECEKNGIPYIVVPHGGLTKKAQKIKMLKKIIGNLIFFNRYIKKSSFIQFLSEQEKNNSIWNKHKNFILGNGIKIPLKQEKNNAGKKKFELLFIGRYDVYFKGLDILLRSILSIKEYMLKNNIILNLYGKGNSNDERYIQNYIQDNNLKDVVICNGPIFGKEKVKKYCEMDVFIQTSRSEGQPMGILEAMSYCLPVLVTPGTGMKFSTETYNLGFVAELDFNSIGDKIKEIYEDKNNLKKYGINARKYVEDNFDGNIIAKKSIEIYQKIIAGVI